MNCMVNSKENYKFDLGVKELKKHELHQMCLNHKLLR